MKARTTKISRWDHNVIAFCTLMRMFATRYAIRNITALGVGLGMAGLAAAIARAQDLDPRLVGHWSSNSRHVNAVVVQDGFAYLATSMVWDPETHSDVIGGLQIVDFRDPANPQTVGSYEAENCDGASDVAVSGHHAYLATELQGTTLNRLEVVDISTPMNPRSVGYCDTVGSPADIAVSGTHAYVAEILSFGGQLKGQLEVIDVSDPKNPQKVGGCDINEQARHIEVLGHYAYVAVSENPYFAVVWTDDSRMQVFDISDPTTPQPVGRHDAVAHAFDVAISGDYAYVIDSRGYNEDAFGEGLLVVDITDPTHPQTVGSFGKGLTSGRVAASGDFALLGTGDSVLILDIRDPTHPQRVGSYGTLGGYTEDDLFLSGDYAYIAGSDGLDVVDLRNTAKVQRVGQYATSSYAYGVAASGNCAYLVTASYWDEQGQEQVRGGVKILDISDPANPRLVGGWDALTGYAADVCVVGSYAYVAEVEAGPADHRPERHQQPSADRELQPHVFH
jgi:hypothetical protein